MDIRQLRFKYRKILESNDDQLSSSRKQVFKRSNVKTRVMTQHCQNISSSNMHNKNDSYAIVIGLKERIAQGIKNLSLKDEQIVSFKTQIIQLEEKLKILEQQIKDYKICITQTQEKVIEQKVYSSTIQKQVIRLQKIIEALNLDKQLLFRQSQFYKNQIHQLKGQKKQCNKKSKERQKQIKDCESIKSENIRLKNDIKRMHTILNHWCQDKRLEIDLTDKHFLGKPYKEANCWFSQNLVGEVQLFLKKEQVAQGNKEFANNLVKFIDKFKQSQKNPQSKSRIKEKDSKKQGCKKLYYRSSSVHDTDHQTSKNPSNLGQSSLKKSILISRYKKLDTRRYTQSFNVSENKPQYLCEQVLQVYNCALMQALDEKQIKSKKIILLGQELKKSIMSIVMGSNYSNF